MTSFDLRHYVPILRWKEAERAALAQLDSDVADRITPLIEIVQENFTRTNRAGRPVLLPAEKAMYEVAGQLYQAWGERPFFIDFVNVPVFGPLQGPDLLDLLSRYAAPLGLRMIPVTGLNRISEWQSSVARLLKSGTEGVCLRLTLTDAQSPTLGQDLASVVSRLGVRPDAIDLIADLEAINSSVTGYGELSNLTTGLPTWRNFVVSAGGFPKDLSGYRKNEQHSIPRLEWALWTTHVGKPSRTWRMPSFGDYTIQCPRYTQRRRGRMRYSASIRYTVQDRWIIMRGENVFRKGGPGFGQYPDLALMLSGLPDYCGEGYSRGDRYIKEISLQNKDTGAATDWLQAGINHHMTYVVRQLATFNSPLTPSLS